MRVSHRRNGATVAALAGIVVVMGGLAYASVPLYRWFCQVTGFGGTTQIATAAPVASAASPPIQTDAATRWT